MSDVYSVLLFFFNDTATTEIYTLSLHDALPIWSKPEDCFPPIWAARSAATISSNNSPAETRSPSSRFTRSTRTTSISAATASSRTSCPCPCRSPPRRSLGEYIRSARMMAAGRPVTIDKFLNREVRRRYAELLASSTFDVIVCDFLVPGSLMHWKTPPPTILFTHNVEAQVWERHYKVTTNPFMKTACWLESRALAGVERRYVELADHVLAVSENDRAFFLQYVDPSRVSVIPTGVDTEYFRPCPDPEQPDTMAFTGTMDWMPNEDGVAY